MALRESGNIIDKAFNVAALVRPSEDVGVDDGDALLAFSGAVVGTDCATLDHARAEVAERLGPAALVAAAYITANFTRDDRIANGLGLPMEEIAFKETVELRERLGLNDYRSATNTLQPR
jgi:hypothetical protein